LTDSGIYAILLRSLKNRSDNLKQISKKEKHMKPLHTQTLKKSLVINKVTVSDLSRVELSDIKAGAAMQQPCWENLWTIYHCDVMYTGDPQVQAAQAAVAPMGR
jgi:hypothetical protein